MMNHSDEKDNYYGLVTNKEGRALALFIRQPFATALSDGTKSIEIRSKFTAIRGNILICSTLLYDYPKAQGGCTIGIAELYDVKPVGELTDEEWEQTRVKDRSKVKGGYAWFFRNQSRVIEFPAYSKNKIGYININLDDIYKYPKYVIYDKDIKC